MDKVFSSKPLGLLLSSTFRSPIMTSSVERKQYEWKHEEDRSFISKESATGNRDMEQLSEGTLFFF